MFNGYISGVSALVVLALSPLAFAQELRIEESTPGASLQLGPAGLSYLPNSTYGYEAYRMIAEGFPQGVELDLWVLPPGSSFKSVTAMKVGVSLSGTVLQWGTTTPLELLFPTEPKGMTYYIGLTTLDRRVRCWKRLRRQPIQVRAGPCQMSAEVEKGLGQTYLLSGGGFHPGEDLRITTRWLKEKQESHGTARSDGTWQGRVALAETGVRSLKANVRIAGRSCTLNLELQRIDPKPKK